MYGRGDTMSQISVNVRMDDQLKKQFEGFCNEVGLNMTAAFNLFAKTVVRQQRIPFEIGLDVPNAQTLEALKEAETITSDPNTKRYASFSELLAEVTDEI